MPNRKPVFYDEQQGRWRVTRRTLEISGALFAVLLVVFCISILIQPDLTNHLVPDRKPGLHAVNSKKPPRKPSNARPGRRRRVAALGKAPENYDPIQAAFYVSWDPTSLASLRQNYRHLDLLIPELLHATSPDGALAIVSDPKLQVWLSSLEVEIPTMALVNNYDGVVWRTKEVTALLANATARARLVRDLCAYATSARQQGLVVDFEDIPTRSQPEFRRFIAELAAGLHRINLKLMVAVPARDSDWDYGYFGEQTDAVILMNYDQHWTTSPAGAIAAQDWFNQNIEETLQDVPREKLIMGIANYAYDWAVPTRKDPRPIAQSISYQQAVVTSMESEATIEFDSDQLNPFYSYVDEKERVHHVWMLDGVTAFNEIRAAERSGARGVAIWRLGSEDPSLWSVVESKSSDEQARSRLKLLPPGYDLVLEGDGDIWRITSEPESGGRQLNYDPSVDVIDGETYLKLPRTYQIDQIGALRGKIALSFDDGPDPRFTPEILDILKAKKAPASFFIIGLSASDHPGLLRRIYNEGHEIGNHTYTHPHFADIPHSQITIELNLTQRLFESVLGIKTILFRPPYGIDHQPESADDVALLPSVQSLGYVLIGSRIDPHDWGREGGGAPGPAAEIAASVIQQARDGKGNIVLLHDGGGSSRANTVAALPQIIDGLRAAGFELVPVSTLLGTTRDQVMPRLSRDEQFVARADAFIFNLYHFLRLSIVFIFSVGLALVSGRAIFVGLLAVIEKMRPEVREHPDFRPSVSVLIPAHNEEAAIADTVRSALSADYPRIEVVVVDDGSTDATAEILERQFAGDPRVRVHHQPNRGKPAALNQALAMATGEIVITIDADTVIEPDTVRRLVRNFVDPRIAAVAGNVKVRNRTRWLTRWQALEYITSQNMEKRAFDLLNCITVVPGALGAWRADVVRAAGGFAPDTLAEDTDLTFSIRRHGGRISYDDMARAHTEAPETAEALIKQRFRWTYGTLQAVWKHRDTLGRPRYGSMGLIALPNVFLFQILLPLVSPVLDLLFVVSLVSLGLEQFHVTIIARWTAEDVQRSLIFFALFMLIDLLTCALAFALERNEDWSLLLPLLLQRFYYRQMMYIVIFRAVMRAWQGGAVGWRGVEPHPRPAAGGA